jgi:hypothetical protein
MSHDAKVAPQALNAMPLAKWGENLKITMLLASA